MQRTFVSRGMNNKHRQRLCEAATAHITIMARSGRDLRIGSLNSVIPGGTLPSYITVGYDLSMTYIYICVNVQIQLNSKTRHSETQVQTWHQSKQRKLGRRRKTTEKIPPAGRRESTWRSMKVESRMYGRLAKENPQRL
jgi:hypothetical protein